MYTQKKNSYHILSYWKNIWSICSLIGRPPVAAIRENTDKENTNFKKHRSLNYAIEALHDSCCNEYISLQIWNIIEDTADVFGLSMNWTSRHLHWAIRMIYENEYSKQHRLIK